MPSTDDVERYYQNRGEKGDNGGTEQGSARSGAYSQEPTELKYLRQIRTATVWMAWLAAIAFAAAVIEGIVIAGHLH